MSLKRKPEGIEGWGTTSLLDLTRKIRLAHTRGDDGITGIKRNEGIGGIRMGDSGSKI